MSTGLIIALDDPDLAAAEALARRLSGRVSAFKVGLTLFASGGPAAISRIADYGRVFCDLKLHDIPHQVGLAAGQLARQGVWMLTVHASGGGPMIKAAVEAVREVDSGALVAGVTVLTSVSDSDLASIGQGRRVEDQVLNLAQLAVNEGASALVCSARHLPPVRSNVGDKVVLVTPGIRATKAAIDDQVQTATPAEAAAAGADYVVVGRPITGAPDPVEVVDEITEQLRSVVPQTARTP